MNFLKFLVLPLLSMLVVACATAPPSSTARIVGEVTTETPLTLPEGSRVRLLLVDARATESRPEPMAEASFAAPARFPIAFELPYEAARIEPAGDYRLIAQVTHHDAVWYSNVLRPRRVLAPDSPTEGVQVAVRKDGVLR